MALDIKPVANLVAKLKSVHELKRASDIMVKKAIQEVHVRY